MFLKSFTATLSLSRKHFLSGVNRIATADNLSSVRGHGYSSIVAKCRIDTLHSRICVIICHKCQVRRHYSRGLIDGDISDLENAQKERELTKLSTLFPNPRVTLNELASKHPSSVFDIHYRQSIVAPKGSRKKATQNDWTCIYSFVWPQKIKFEGAAISKRQAAEKAAIQALHWLYINKRIDSKGFPVFDKSVIEELSSTIQEPIRASISDKSMEQIQKIWEDYENGIKEIYENTFEAAKRRVITSPAAMTKDSTIDEEDDLSEGDSVPTQKAYDLFARAESNVHPVYCKHVHRPTETALDRRKRQLMKTFDYYDEERTPLPIDEYSSSKLKRHMQH